MADTDQYAAYVSNNSLVIKAGPGSGKTMVLTMKLVKLLKEKVRNPRKVACIAYSRESSKEILHRVEQLLNKKVPNAFINTIHSFCLSQIIIPFAHLYDYDFPSKFKIVSDKKKNLLFKDIMESLGYLKTDLTIEQMDAERTLMIAGNSKIEVESCNIALKVALKYEEQLKQDNLIDFITIIKTATTMIQNEPYVRKCLEAKFPWILIDEYQDLGRPLHEMVLTLVTSTKIKIIAVGDPDQSIYGFSGATPKYFLELEHFPVFEVIHLKNNYRSHQQILDASVSILGYPPATYMAAKEFEYPPELHLIRCNIGIESQYEYITNTVIQDCISKGIPYNQIAILTKSKFQIEELNKMFMQKQIPCFVAVRNLKRTDLIIWLEDCASWCKDINNINFEVLVTQWIRFNKENSKKCSDIEILLYRNKLYRILKESKNITELEIWIEFLNVSLDFESVFKNNILFPNEWDSYIEMMKEVQNGEFKSYSIEDFADLNKQKNEVYLTTRHSSKGLEFEVIIVIGMEDGMFPFYKNFDYPEKMREEERLFFVCLSRAKRICYLLMSDKYLLNGKYGPFLKDQKQSRFWDRLENVKDLNIITADYLNV
ncbi:ATP-dependent helicase [Lysinibacillus sphaericus]|uniref:ATP-dependent helicase n=1 Tax=Lysinibacillus sphaericus TaxID=1421 RepID=UPI0018CFAA7D|nr:ATP-dependent helicase [Lysinibacillus sphaericus]